MPVETLTCTRCGAALRDGVCPNGHPQRAARHVRRGRRRWGRLLAIVVILGLLAGAAYASLVWYPAEVTGDAMGPVSADYAQAFPTYEATLGAFPTEPDPETIATGAGEVLQRAAVARESLTEAQLSLSQRALPDLPVISDRPPLSVARQVREDMEFFYTNSLEVVTDLEGLSRYLTELEPALPRLENMRRVLGDPRTPGEVNRAVAAATPIADQVIADLRALRTPEEMGPVHASLVTVARAIRRDLREIGRVGRQGRSPVLRALIEDVRNKTRTIRDSFSSAPGEVLAGALEPQIDAVERAAERVEAGLVTLRDDYRLTGLTVPED